MTRYCECGQPLPFVPPDHRYTCACGLGYEATPLSLDVLSDAD